LYFIFNKIYKIILGGKYFLGPTRVTQNFENIVIYRPKMFPLEPDRPLLICS
jgi:hypothetical protein